MPSTIRLRRMRRDDHPALIEILRRTWYADPELGEERSHRLAEADFEYCLARSTEAFVAVEIPADDTDDAGADGFTGADDRAGSVGTVAPAGRPVGVILGRVEPSRLGKERRRRFRLTRLNRHHLRSAFVSMPLLASKAGRRALRVELAIARVDARLLRDAGRSYAAEVTLFLVGPCMRGRGVGGRLFARMMRSFRACGVRDYFLYTDTSCDVGFYDRRGLTRVAARTLDYTSRCDRVGDDGASDHTDTYYLYQGHPEPVR
ncbi:GNAT family N-acetyltransferase [Bifidobacterium samirii]|uniref:N-acetyltransferase GCN5 n=1 Tax=Bifidobacterium samirii TaxID=2306974 RepID=A0A430FNV1_9BIFI|nr:GNAT family N-acetyltransferase [Bifidobacterium samirii]RSX54499.1 N-acetyltransferase GCN5 [Bifidobacterium samirii]